MGLTAGEVPNGNEGGIKKKIDEGRGCGSDERGFYGFDLKGSQR